MSPPSISKQVNRVASPQERVLTNGLRLLHLPGDNEDAMIGIYFTGGSIDDPVTGTGLTAFLANAGLSPSPEEGFQPTKEALSLGSNIVAFSDNTVFGWNMHTSRKDLPKAIQLLHRIATRQVFNSSTLATLSNRAADELTGLTDPGVQQALAVAVSSAIGLAVPRGLYGNANHFRQVKAATIAKHWQRLVTPRRGVLVIKGGEIGPITNLANTLFHSWTPPRVPASPVNNCWPDRTTAHLIVDPTATSRRVYSLIALRVPSLGEPGRKEVELALDTFGRVPGGRLAKVLGESKARDISPHIVDLGWNGGDKGSVILMRLSGPSRETLRALWVVIETLNGIGNQPPSPEEITLARRHLLEQASHDDTIGLARLRTLAKQNLYGSNNDNEDDFVAHIQAIFRRRNVSVIGVGPNPLGPVLSELGPLTVWDSGGLILEGNNRPGCP